MPGFDLKNYEQVDTRIDRFWSDHPEGRILPELTFNDGSTFIFRVEVYTDREDTRPAAIGHATETVSQKGVNSTSALENAETSAIGRALANLNYATKGNRPSREEMSKTEQARAAHAAQQNGNGQQRPPQGQNGAQRPVQPAQGPEQVAKAAGALLNAADAKALEGLAGLVEERQIGERDATAAVTAADRETLGLDEADKVTLDDLVALLRSYHQRHKTGPRSDREPAPLAG